VANITRYVDAILESTPIYVLYSQAQRSADDDIRVFAAAMRDTVVSRVALNNLGTPDPPAFARAVLDGYASFVEETCTSWRDRGLSDRQELEQLLGSVFASVITAARAA
jgi:hypothetical protein